MFESDTQDTFNTPLGYGRQYPASQQYDVRAVPMRTSNSLGEDVDMMDADEELPVANAPNAINERAITSYIVLDTNIFDHNLDLLRPFVDEVEQLHSALPVTFIVPGIVIRELDGQQKRRDAPSLSRAAAAASRWLASSGKGPTLIREQREAETVRESGNWRKGWAVGEINDDSIIDCCKYFRDKLGADVVLWTEDNLLKFRTESANEAIRILKRPPDVSEKNWSCQAIVRALGTLYGSEALASYAVHFSNDQRVSRAASQRHGFDAMTPSGSNFVDYMEVDWVVSVDPRDSLQMDMIERLGGFMREVLLRVAPANVLSRAPAASIYALPFERRSFANWTLSDQVQYFGPAGRKWLTKGDADHLTQFLLMTSEKCEYSGIGRGKPGNTWTASQWRGAMRSLREIGKRANRESEYVGLANYLDDVRAAASAFNIALDTDEGDQ